MSKEIPNKIIELRNEIYKDIYDKNRWVYVKIQSLLEYVNKYYNSIEGYYESIELLSNMDRTISIANELGIQSDIISIFKKVNYLANNVKHSFDKNILEETKYDLKLIELFINAYNKYCEYLFGNKCKMYQLEHLSTFDNNYFEISSNILNSKDEKTIIKSNGHKKDSPLVIYTGIGNHDYGFQIHNISFENQCNSYCASIFAVIFNFLQRSKNLKKSVFIRDIESEKRIIRNYKNIYRYEIILLCMIRNNYFSENELNVYTCDGDMRELEIAVDDINCYASNISILMNVDYKPLVLVKTEDMNIISIHGDSTATVYSTDNSESVKGIKEFWFENSIKYQANNSSKVVRCLEHFLFEFFGYKTFKPGQLEALIVLLNGDKNCITLLPTGGGKSLLYYFLALLQPKQTLVVSPTEILIKDQIRNLKELHNFDDSNCFIDNYDSQYSASKKFLTDNGNLLVFITPEKLQHRSVIMPLISQNVENRISNVVLDEIHTISNWSHDFRPDYLMLSFNLLEHLDNARYLGFTATANYRVLKDVVGQLKISENSIVSPVDLRRNNIDFTFVQCENEDILLSSFHDQIKRKYEKLNFEHKTIVFTKGKVVSESIKNTSKDDLKWNIDVFCNQETFSYEGFVKGRKSILVCEEEMGVGINIPMVQNAIHFGTPTSKAQYVQEIGRVDRFGEGGESIVLYKPRAHMNKYERVIIDFNSSIDEILSTLKILEDDNDLKLTFTKLLGHITHYSKMASGIYELFERLVEVDNYLRISFKSNISSNILTQQVYMYFLFKMGIIHNWYLVEKNEKYITYDIEVSDAHTNLIFVKKKSIDYIASLGFYSQEIHLIEEATTIKEIIYLVQSWYYNQFLRYHREQLLNIIDFFEMNLTQKARREEIVEQLSDYFSGSLISDGNNEKSYVMALTIREMIESIEIQSNVALISKIERVLENEYIAKLDLYVCIHQIVASSHLNTSRIQRALGSINKSTLFDFMDNLYLLYLKLTSDLDKLEFVKCLSKMQDYDYLMENLYSKINKDKLYYAYLAKHVNKEINKFKGGSN